MSTLSPAVEGFLARLKANAFDRLSVEGHQVDEHGWMSEHFTPAVRAAVDSLDRAQHLVVIEVGTWKGRSTLGMAQALRDMGFQRFTIITVDTWLGAPEFWTWGMDDSTRGGSLRLQDGYPSVFYTFTRNVKSLGFQHHVAPLPISSLQGADVLTHYGVQADLIYIDAAHEYEPVLSDLRAYWKLLKPGRTVLGDDYHPNWPGVKQAVDQFSAEGGVPVAVTDVVWAMQKK